MSLFERLTKSTEPERKRVGGDLKALGVEVYEDATTGGLALRFATTEAARAAGANLAAMGDGCTVYGIFPEGVAEADRSTFVHAVKLTETETGTES